jgi:hypothetical protein
MRYPDLEMQSILTLARAARELERNSCSAQFSSADTIAQLASSFGTARTMTLIELVLDHEDRLADFHDHWKRWRRRKLARVIATRESTLPA